MKKRIPVYAAVLVALAAVIVSAVVTAQICYRVVFVPARHRNDQYAAELSKKISELDPEKDYSLSGKVKKIVDNFDKYYTGEYDRQALEDDLLKFLLHNTNDRYAQYYTASDYEALNASDDGKGVGIGVFVSQSPEGAIVITYVEEGGPAMLSKLRKGDVITAVEGQKVSDIGYDAATDLLRGEAGSEVRFTFLREGAEHELSVTRQKINFKTVRFSLEKDGIGYIRILSFGNNTFAEFKNAVDTLTASGAAALIFDVRSNGGGSLSSIHKVLDYLIEDGEGEGNVILSTVDALENTRYYRCGDGHKVTLPMAVLTNGSTASAAELFTAALRDYDMALTVGAATYGKGVAQTFFEFPDGSAYKFTTNYYNPPSGVNYDGEGVKPDVPVEDGGVNFNLLDLADDPVYTAAAAALKK